MEAQGQIIEVLGLAKTEARIEAQVLLQHSLSVNRAWLLAHATDVLIANQQVAFEALLNRRLTGEPIAHILGKREFYGLDFAVTPDTLIPRPDTETLVEAALEKIPVNQPCSVLDLGTGTGAIAIAIASQRQQAQVTAVDQAQKALDVAQRNARNLGINNVRFVLSDWFTELQSQTFDVIISNPPYIAETDPHLMQGDLRFEPQTALAAGKDGLDSIRQILSQAAAHLKPNGWLMFEHGYDQAVSVADLMLASGFQQIDHRQDIAQIVRVTLGKMY